MKCYRTPLFVPVALFWMAAGASAVTFEWVTVGNPGNACDNEPLQGCFGRVDYAYRIGKYEVTNAQYAEFLNAKAASDPLGLYNSNMATFGGITRSGSSGDFTYSVIPGRGNKPVVLVSYFDALRFANWLHNGQGNGDTETGAYTLVGGTPTPSNPLVGRNPSALVFIPTEDEWYKAAYYSPTSGTYFRYPAGTSTQTVCSGPTATPNRANCGGAAGGLTDVGSYSGSPSPSGTFDQGGNVEEWCDAIIILENRPLRAGAYYGPADRLSKVVENYDDPWFEFGGYGFRIASVAGQAICGDAVCDDGESTISCPADCPAVCGDDLCSGSEDLSSCPVDCSCTSDAECDDGHFCNGAERCAAGACQAGTPVDCDDFVGCTLDACDEAADTCDHAPLDVVCDDNFFCNGAEYCDPLLGCQPGVGLHCDDGIACTVDFCYEVTHLCMYAADDDSCADDGLFCNGDEVCDADFGCTHAGNPCAAGQTCNEATNKCESACRPRLARCSRNADCCSNRCLTLLGVCR